MSNSPIVWPTHEDGDVLTKYREYGWGSYLQAGYDYNHPRTVVSFAQGVPRGLSEAYIAYDTQYHSAEDIMAAHSRGWFEAKSAKEKYPALFYLAALQHKMDEADEWYGDSFDFPSWLLARATDALQAGEEG